MTTLKERKLDTADARWARMPTIVTGDEYVNSLRIATSPDDLVMKNKMRRRMGQLTGTCFQRCTGLDTLSVLQMRSTPSTTRPTMRA